MEIGMHTEGFEGLSMEIGMDTVTFTVTAAGCRQNMPTNNRTFPFEDGDLHCHYGIETKKDAVVFHLQRNREDLLALLEDAGHLNISNTIGLWQELPQI